MTSAHRIVFFLMFVTSGFAVDDDASVFIQSTVSRQKQLNGATLNSTSSSSPVIFDGAVHSDIVVSPGTVGGTCTGWRCAAAASRTFAKGDSIIGVSFKATTSESHIKICITDTVKPIDSNPALWWQDCQVGMCFRGTMVATTPLVLQMDDPPNYWPYTGTFAGNGDFANDVYSIEINSNDHIDIKRNGAVFFTSANPVRYPWHVLTDTYTPTSPSTLNSIQYVTGGGGGGGGASAHGDPHMTNVLGESFDLRRTGAHVLLHIPRGAEPQDALLHVEARVRRGVSCWKTYIRTLNITGLWAEKDKSGGMHFAAESLTNLTEHQKTQVWQLIAGPVHMKVSCVYTNRNFAYLNFAASHLGKVGQPIGGILGEDDHVLATTAKCPPELALQAVAESSDDPESRGRADMDPTWADME